MISDATSGSRMTNREAKANAIREAYGEYWEEVSGLADPDGWIPVVKIEDVEDVYDALDVELDGYREHWRPLSLKGVEDNRGWMRINGPNTLPKKEGKYLVLGKSGKMEEWHYSNTSSVRSVWLEYFTHWRPTVEIPGPVY